VGAVFICYIAWSGDGTNVGYAGAAWVGAVARTGGQSVATGKGLLHLLRPAKDRREGSAAYLAFHAWHRDGGILSISVARLIDVKNIATNACAHVLTPASTLYAEFAIRASIVYHETAHNWLSIADVARITESSAAGVYLP